MRNNLTIYTNIEYFQCLAIFLTFFIILIFINFNHYKYYDKFTKITSKIVFDVKKLLFFSTISLHLLFILMKFSLINLNLYNDYFHAKLHIYIYKSIQILFFRSLFTILHFYFKFYITKKYQIKCHKKIF